jgi:AcrR family transcriptional regulator
LKVFFAAQKPQRKPRTDTQRNRERILEVAKEAFARSGASTSLDDIAQQAGVGAGTLYRHFPTRDALLEAVLFVDYIEAKQIIAPALTIHARVERAIKSGDIRKDLEPFALIGVSNVASGPDWQQRTRRLVDILITGSRPIR